MGVSECEGCEMSLIIGYRYIVHSWTWTTPWTCQLLKPLLGCSDAAASQRRISQSALRCESKWPARPLLLPVEWDLRMCFLRSKLRQNPLEHTAQMNGLTSLCVCIWNDKLYTCTYIQANNSLSVKLLLLLHQGGVLWSVRFVIPVA